AQGAAYQAVRAAGVVCECISEQDWTGGEPKAERATRIAAAYPEYAAWHRRGKDPGLDVADALGLCVYRISCGGAKEAKVTQTHDGRIS
ncbi:MAG: hypothetical protein IRY99_17995, partial [Isosphaeraceae bacterium]|nr:hypothetical protein [Isosphaeraceae bacterium]